MAKPTKEELLDIVEKEEVEFIEFQFMDILGTVKCMSVPVARMERALDEGILFDGSSIVGYATIDESDMRAHPDHDTFLIFPWTEGRMKTARMICDIFTIDGKRFRGDPRYILQRQMDKAKELGFVFNTGPEFEFFLFKLDEHGEPTTTPTDHGGYFDLLPLDQAERVRKETALYLDQLKFNVERTTHEVSPGQHEIDLRYDDALSIADRILMLKHAIKTVALQHNLWATFMPKPVYGVNGSGMHVHQSLFTTEGENAFYDPKAKNELSKTMTHYITGILNHAKDNCAILNSWVNSYKRIVPGFEAPAYISWANRNRSALVRVPAGRGAATRIEVRNPDPAGNPYLQFAVMLASGLDGIKKRLDPPDPVEKDLFVMSQKDREKNGIESLPANLGHALSYFAKSELMKDTLGEHAFNHFIVIKQREWDTYRTQVTRWEIENYLKVL